MGLDRQGPRVWLRRLVPVAAWSCRILRRGNRSRRRVEPLSHAAIRDRTSEYRDRTLEPRDREAVEAHLRRCPPCRAFARTLAGAAALLGELPQPTMPPAARARLLDLAAAAARQEAEAGHELVLTP